MMAHVSNHIRHAELVSASIMPSRPALAAKWTLKQVQGDEEGEDLA